MDNVGGLAKLYVCPIGNLTVGGGVADVAKLVEIRFIEDTGVRKCVRKSDKNGEFYDLTVECVVASADVEAVLMNLFRVDFALVCVSANGGVRLDGSRSEPMHYEYESNTGEKFEDLSCVELKFSRKLRFASPVITL